MAAPRNENIRELILNETTKLMEENGMDNVSLANIADQCGISKGTLYYHYKSKEDIFLDITDRYLEQLEKELLVWMDDQSKDVSVNRVVMYVLARSMKLSGPRLQLLYAASNNNALRKKVLSRYDKFQKVISEKIAVRDNYTKEEASYIAWAALFLADGAIIQSQLKSSMDMDRFIEDTETILGKMLH